MVRCLGPGSLIWGIPVRFYSSDQAIGMRRKITVVGVIAVVLIAAFGAARVGEPLEDPIPEPIPQGTVKVKLETVATGLTAPNWGTHVPRCESLLDRLVVTDQDGILWNIHLATGEKTVFLDVSDRLVDLGVAGPNTFDERGLLGVAFHPLHGRNGLLYTYTSEPVSGDADFSTIPEGETADHQSVILEWQVPEPCDPSSVVDPTSASELLRIDQPQFNHDGGALNFGPDGMLYIALGDGGAAEDQGVGHSEGGNGQDPGNVLGTILRIDPTGDDSANGQYGIPFDNPFVSQAGFVDEIFAYGFRNPFRFSFDRRTGNMYIADVGQNDIEEVDLGVAGGNYGWNLKEGSFCFDPNGDASGFVFDCELNETLIDPIAEYDHDEGIAVIGGFVYRGSDIQLLRGRYVFGDYSQSFFGNNGRLFYLDSRDEIVELQLAGQGGLGLSLLGFGEDARGELYVLGNMTGIPFGDTGVVLKIATPPAGGPGITVSPTSGLTTREAGGADTFTVVLDTVPTANVTIGVSSDDTSEGTVSPASLTFTPANALTSKTVTVTGVDDAIVDGDIGYNIVTDPAASADLDYNGTDPANVSVTSIDDDSAPTVISVGEYFFSPDPVTIRVRDAVTWDFSSNTVEHTTTADGSDWDSGLVSPGGAYSFTFTAAGTFPYRCTVPGHAGLGMVGTIIVE